jgi:hypothetical protein
MKHTQPTRITGLVFGLTAATLTTSLPPALAASSSDDSRIKPASHHSHAAMQSVPRLQPKRVVTVTGNEDWDAQRGFGKDAAMAEMMTLMMVGGSGMEHMKMGPMKKGGTSMAGMNVGGMNMGDMASAGASNPSPGLPLTVTVTPNPPVVGDNTLDITATDASGQPVTGLKLAASVAMTSMDMGTTKPKVTEGQTGHFTTVVNFSMKGPWRVMLTGSAPGSKTVGTIRTALDFNAGGAAKWSQRASPTTGHPAAPTTDQPAASAANQPVGAAPEKPAASNTAQPAASNPSQPSASSAGRPAGPHVTLNTPAGTLRVGKNTLQFTVLDAAGKPISGAKVTTAVAMTSMDMGTAHPQVREGKGGRYTTEVDFSMKGPWRVTLTVMQPSQKPFTQTFDFDVNK